MNYTKRWKDIKNNAKSVILKNLRITDFFVSSHNNGTDEVR